MFNPDLWLHTLAALAGPPTIKFNSKRSLKKKKSVLQVESQSTKESKYQQLPTCPSSYSEQSSHIILPCPTPAHIPQFQDIHQIKDILPIPKTAGLEKYLTFQTSTKVALISYMSDILLSTAKKKKIQ